jgi:hypothetical protein
MEALFRCFHITAPTIPRRYLMPLNILNDIRRVLEPLFLNMEWAEEEITTAQERHPAAAERLDRSFRLLTPTHSLMSTEAVYRAHCRELLDRVARGEDTRPGTAAECCLALHDTSLKVPLKTSAVGLYARLLPLAQIRLPEVGDALVHYEALTGSRMDDLEAWLRAKLRQSWRTPVQPDQEEIA